MTGRAVPRSAVAGTDDFDATQLFIQERGFTAAERSTASLLLETFTLIARAVRRISTDTGAAFDFWAELVRRQVPMERVYAGGMAPILARIAARQAVTEIFVEIGVIDAQALAESTPPAGGRSWGELVQGIVSDEPPKLGDSMEVDLGLIGLVLAHHDEATEGVAWSRLMQRSDVMYAVSASFLARAEEWFTGIASHELASVFEPSVPSSDLFLGFPGHPDEDAHGKWIWCRRRSNLTH